MDRKVIDYVKEIQNGETEAFQDLFIECYSDVYRMAMKHCRNEEDAKDIVQDTYIELTKSIYSLRNPDYFFLWLKRIVLSKCVKLFRKEKYITMNNEQLYNASGICETYVSYLPKESTENQEEQLLMHEIVEQLPEHYRIVIELIYFEEMNMEEAQAFLDIPMGTLKSRLHTARKLLKEAVKKYEKKENRKIEFYDLGTTTLSSLFSLAALKEIVKEKIITTSVSQVITYTVIAVSCASTAVLSVEAGTTIVKEYQETHKQTQLRQPVASKQKEINQELPESNFYVEYQGSSILTEQDAYFTIIAWAEDPSFIESKSEIEKQTILPVYQALEKNQSIYWDLLYDQGYIFV